MIIAAVDNNHFGCMYRAKELIAAAHESGADLIKMQAFHPQDMRSGSMPLEFYAQCALSVAQCLDLIEYARRIKNDLFFEIFSRGFIDVRRAQTWIGVTGEQYANDGLKDYDDLDESFVSIQERSMSKIKQIPKRATALYASEPLAKDPKINNIKKLRELIGRPVGYSDHTVGVDWCRVAHNIGAVVIEKHFALKQNEEWRGDACEDSVHSVTPAQFKELVSYCEYEHGGLQQ